MKEQFEVIALENETMTLKVNRSGGCGSCSANSSCGTGVLAKYFDHYATINKPLKNGVRVGDFVTLEISSSELLVRAFILYIFPLFGLFFVGLLGMRFFPNNEPMQIMFAFFGLFAALGFCRWFYHFKAH